LTESIATRLRRSARQGSMADDWRLTTGDCIMPEWTLPVAWQRSRVPRRA
jgi:hypothetical protein